MSYHFICHLSCQQKTETSETKRKLEEADTLITDICAEKKMESTPTERVKDENEASKDQANVDVRRKKDEEEVENMDFKEPLQVGKDYSLICCRA